MTNRDSRVDLWTEQQRLGMVLKEIEYEEHPRGRVVFNTTERFTMYADRCILIKNMVVNQIRQVMHLPRRLTDVRTDGHYSCYRCLETSARGGESELRD